MPASHDNGYWGAGSAEDGSYEAVLLLGMSRGAESEPFRCRGISSVLRREDASLPAVAN